MVRKEKSPIRKSPFCDKGFIEVVYMTIYCKTETLQGCYERRSKELQQRDWLTEQASLVRAVTHQSSFGNDYQ